MQKMKWGLSSMLIAVAYKLREQPLPEQYRTSLKEHSAQEKHFVDTYEAVYNGRLPRMTGIRFTPTQYSAMVDLAIEKYFWYLFNNETVKAGRVIDWCRNYLTTRKYARYETDKIKKIREYDFRG